MQLTITDNAVALLLLIVFLPHIHLLLIFAVQFVFERLLNFVAGLARFMFDVTVTFLIMFFLLRVYLETISFDYTGFILDSHELFHLVEQLNY